jgi:exodeoxyribonuclease V beta subunit
MRPLDSLRFPLSGASLIEASAGTGKTYTIVNLYLRLLLGHGCQPLNVEQILVVTFTHAATAELKTRIRQRLTLAYLDFYRGHSDDAFLQTLLAELPQRELATQRLALASKSMDEAAIFTIHGFCQRALSEHAFESGAMYEQHFILDESQWLKLAVEDFWRRTVVTQSSAVQANILDHWPTPSELLEQLKPLLVRGAEVLEPVTLRDALARYQHYNDEVQAFKRWWHAEGVEQLIANTDFIANRKAGKAANLQQFADFCRGDDLHPTNSDGWLLYGPANIESASKKSTRLPDVDFTRFERMHDLQQAASNALLQGFSCEALCQVKANLAEHKTRLQLLSPDDLLSQLAEALSRQQTSQTGRQQNALAQSILARYPAVLIDEFQDTDPTQFAIFQGIYGEHCPRNAQTSSAPCWIMIGDPKQAIYGFRGADIFTYIQAKRQVSPEQQFTLSTNWRSTPALINAVNQLFSHSEGAFLFDQDIPFLAVSAGQDTSGLMIKGHEQASLSFWHLPSHDDKPLAKEYAQARLAKYCAGQLSLLLDSVNQATAAGKPIQARDCCVLVRTRHEAQLIKTACAQRGIAAMYLVRKSVFASQMAEDLYRVLQALLQPANDRLLRGALLSELFNQSAAQLDALFNDDTAWQQVVSLFYQWQQDWQQHGLMLALNKLLLHFSVRQHLSQQFSDGLRRLTDLQHLLELLQEQSAVVQGQAQLSHWFKRCIQQPDTENDSQQLRLETDANLVQITTLHASKGLQYPLVFMPFASAYRAEKTALFHNDKGKLHMDFLGREDNKQAAEHERLAEDIRLVYVALTRAMYFCAVGVWHNTHAINKRASGFKQSALGSLLSRQSDEINDALIEARILEHSARAAVGYQAIPDDEAIGQAEMPLASATLNQPAPLSPLNLTRSVDRQWRLTSYSALSRQQAHLDFVAPGQDEGLDQVELKPIVQIGDMQQNSAFTFAKGANAGSFLHGVLENIDFQQASRQLPEVIAKQSKLFAIETQWQSTLETWLSDVLQTPFSTAKGSHGLTLSALSAAQVKVEMEFYMPLKQVHVAPFNQLINHYMPQFQRHYDFAQLNGMIKGFIDLVFYFEGKFYVADYKSNHLGHVYEDYQYGALDKAMQQHDYYLQAILYSVALHRWLQQHWQDYQFEQHYGGAYYLFLRGMHSTLPGNGVLHYLPPAALVLALDKLFAGQDTSSSQDILSGQETESGVSGQKSEAGNVDNSQKNGPLEEQLPLC